LENQYPKHIIATSAYIENEEGHVLLVKTHSRRDTFELPGGQVEEGEALDQAVMREVYEETGIRIRPIGITGIYYNVSMHLLSVVFRAEYISGNLLLQPDEIKEGRFIELTCENIDQWITRPQMKSRTLDARKAVAFIPYETWEMDPSKRISRLAENAEPRAFDPKSDAPRKERN
jgi:8-oxo-dGTP diphosphatase